MTIYIVVEKLICDNLTSFQTGEKTSNAFYGKKERDVVAAAVAAMQIEMLKRGMS